MKITNLYMKKLYILVLISALPVWGIAQSEQNDSNKISSWETTKIGYELSYSKDVTGFSTILKGSDIFENATSIDVSKALYGKIAGLNVYQGLGSSSDNISGLSIHGHAPIVLIDGYVRSIQDVNAAEIESISVLKDATATALYGVQGANGVVLLTTKRGTAGRLKATAKYQFGLSSQFRSPKFADAYTYASYLNSALISDGFAPKYNTNELAAFKDETYPFAYPNVNWWDEVYKKIGTNHRLELTFDGGSEKFRYFSVIDYMRDKGLFDNTSEDNRYNSNFTDTRLKVRANIDVAITNTTQFKFGLASGLREYNAPCFGNIYDVLYKIPSAAFPIRQENGIYGGNAIYGVNNPFALLNSTGSERKTYGDLFVDANLCQDLGGLLKGLSADLSIAFDNCGGMFDKSTLTYRYSDLQPSIIDHTLVTNPVIYGDDSEILNHSSGFHSLYMNATFRGKINYNYNRGLNQVNTSLIYDQNSFTANGRNQSKKRQSIMAVASYSYNSRYSISGVLNYSGSAYLDPDDRFDLYPAVSAAWNMTDEGFMKNLKFINNLRLNVSYGLSGWDGNLRHELFRQSYGNTDRSYYFTNNVAEVWGKGEGALPILNLSAERSAKGTLGFNLIAFNNHLSVDVEGFFEKRTQILTNANNVSGIIGIGIGQLCSGIEKYRGFDASFSWKDRISAVDYGLDVNMSYVNSELVEANEEYQQYDYLYHKGNRVGQSYGLEVEGFFNSEMEINNSPQQLFGGNIRPGDIKYKDQNGDNVIDSQDRVKMFGSSIPRFYFGFTLNVGYKNFNLSADFQGLTGRTISLLDSPLYKPLVSNGNLSQTLLDNEQPWTVENATTATLPRLTTLPNENNYQHNSLWFRDGSFLKLRNLRISYLYPKTKNHMADVKVYLQGNNLFSLDNVDGFDPEQLGATYPSLRTYWMGLQFSF